jgi:predicted RNase H-like HicB family nuclease
LVVFEKAGENYSAFCPDMPGCIATGATQSETENNIKGAIRMHQEGLKEDGAPLPSGAASAEYIEVV